MAEVAEREIERWPAGEPLSAWPAMQAITLEVIMRAVFGVARRGPARAAARRRSSDSLDLAGRARGGWRMLALLGPRRDRASSAWLRNARSSRPTS